MDPAQSNSGVCDVDNFSNLVSKCFLYDKRNLGHEHDCRQLIPWNSGFHARPVNFLISSFSCSLIGSNKPMGSKNSETCETTSRLVMVTEDNSFTASSRVTTGESFGFFAPLTFLFRFSSENPGDNVSSLVDHL